MYAEKIRGISMELARIDLIFHVDGDIQKKKKSSAAFHARA